ncbi:YopT-type cysteine protease domain-containing protein [Chelativorans salis]|uniref:YopT-type cysteine protease domain-containing protein n=1 Tax=Chelativorans salis TaxID=2978478 RepID=A0ABT2LH48_9HYPH|nr:YopT-type cysteine protease domain-containing protein [Chelativorans sp. EGI FJ00035]MCT7373867.1 YopT-type cysteine protease domain-containing protein [Chelativorans sp. EGI FJ00035]
MTTFADNSVPPVKDMSTPGAAVDAALGGSRTTSLNPDLGTGSPSLNPATQASLSEYNNVYTSIAKSQEKAAAAEAQGGGDTEAADSFAPMADEAELRETLRGAFMSYMRDEFHGWEASDQDVLSSITEFPDLEDGDRAYLLARKADYYGGMEGETDVAPAQKKYLAAQLLLALTDEIDWAAELDPQDTPAQGVTFDGTVLHGAGAMTITQAAAAAEEKISTTLKARLGDWAMPMADKLAPVLIGDPTLFLPEVPDNILYGSPEWAQLRIGMEYADGLALYPEQLSVDDFLALGHATMAEVAEADAEAADGQAAQDEDAGEAAHFWATRFLTLIALASDKLILDQLTTEHQDEIEKTLEDVAEEVFKEEFAIAQALEALDQVMPTRRQLAEIILKKREINTDQVLTRYIPAGDGPCYEEESLPISEMYFQQGNLDDYLDCDLPILTEEFDNRFTTYKSEVSAGMETILGHLLDNYAKHNNLNLSSATITFSQPRLSASIRKFFWFDSVDETSDRVLIVEIAIPGSSSRYGFFSLSDLDKGLQDIPAGTSVSEWISNNISTSFTKESAEKYNELMRKVEEEGCKFDTSEGSIVLNSDIFFASKILSGSGTEIRGKINEYYAAQIQQYYDQARGETTGEAIGNFFLDLIPFRAMIVAIQKGDVGGATFNGLFDILSFIPFVGQGIKALQLGGKAVVGGLSAAIKTALKQGLKQGIAAGLRTTGSLGREFGWRILKTTVTGLEDALPIPTPSLASHISVAGAKDIARVAERLKATLPELANTLKEAASRSRLVEIGLDGKQTLASGVRVTEDAKGLETIGIPPHGADLDKIELILGRNDGGEIVFLKEHYDEEGDRFYTLADPRTGQSYGTRLAAESLSPVTAENLSPEFCPIKNLVNRILFKPLKLEFPEDLFNSGVETFNNVTPEITSITELLQSQIYTIIINNKEVKRSGVCAAYVSHFLHARNEPSPSIPDGFSEFLVNLQKEYAETFRGRVSSKSLLYRRGLMTTREITKHEEHAVSDIVDFFAKGRSSAYMAIHGKSGSGHALGLAWKNDKPVFFDPNWGVFEFKNIAELAKWVPEYITKHYKNISVAFAYEVHKKAW